MFGEGLSSEKAQVGTPLWIEKTCLLVSFQCSIPQCPQLLPSMFGSAVEELLLMRNHRSWKAERNALVEKYLPS